VVVVSVTAELFWAEAVSTYDVVLTGVPAEVLVTSADVVLIAVGADFVELLSFPSQPHKSRHESIAVAIILYFI